jgi:hypothetical protein
MIVHNMQIQSNVCCCCFGWKFVQNLRLKIHPKSFRPKWCSVKIDPWMMLTGGSDGFGLALSSGDDFAESLRGQRWPIKLLVLSLLLCLPENF